MALLDTILTLTKHRGAANGVASLDGTGKVPAGQLPAATAHAATHASGGGDAVTLAESQVTGLTAALAAKQALDATLTALADLNATAGIVEQTGSDAFTKRAFGVGASTSVPTRADADTRYQAANANLTAVAAAATTPVVMQTATVSLTNAEILALPTTAKQLIAAPGAGFQLLVYKVTAKAVIVGAVTNIDTGCVIAIAYPGESAGVSELEQADSHVSALLANVDTNKRICGVSGASGVIADMENQALRISADNAAAGAFTGGNAGNSMVVTVKYEIVPI